MVCGIMILDGIPIDIIKEGNLFYYINNEGIKYLIEGLPNKEVNKLLDKREYVNTIVYNEIGDILGIVLFKDKLCILLNEFEAVLTSYGNIEKQDSDKFSINLNNEII